MTPQQWLTLALQASILVTVFGFGLQATPVDVLYVARRPSLLARSLLAMFVIMPVIAIGIAQAFDLFRAVKIILVVLALSPVPPLLPGKGRRVGGHSTFGLGLMVMVSLLSIVLVPALVRLLGLYLGRDFNVTPAEIAVAIFKVALLPLGAGLALRTLAPRAAARIAAPVSLAATVLLVASLLVLVAWRLPAALELARNGTLLALTAFVVSGLAVGHWLGGPDREHRLVLAVATAGRQPVIALAVATANFPGEPHLAGAILLYLVVSALVGLPYVRWAGRTA